MHATSRSRPAWGEEMKRFIALAWPLAFSQIGYHLTGFVDVAVAGRLDETALGAVGLGASLFLVLTVVGLGLVLGVDPLVSQALGAGEGWHGRHVLWQGVYTAALVTVPLTGGMVLLANGLEAVGVEPSLAEPTRVYLLARLPSLFPFLASIAVRSYLQSAHVVRPIVVATVVTNAFNFVADAILAFGDPGLVAWGLPALGIPPLGVAGIAWASTVSFLAQLGVTAWAVALIPAPTGVRSYRRFNGALVWRMSVLGLPIGLHLLAELGVFALVQVLMGRIGVLATSAHQVAISCAGMSFAVVLGIGAATAVQVGRAVGREDPGETRRAGWLGFVLGALFMLAPATVMIGVPRVLGRLLTDEPEVIVAAVELLRIAAAFQLVDGIQAVGAGALRGAGDTRFTFAANVVGHWGIGFPVGWTLAFPGGMGPAGLWWGLTVGLAVVALALAFRFWWVTRTEVARAG